MKIYQNFEGTIIFTLFLYDIYNIRDKFFSVSQLKLMFYFYNHVHNG